MDSKGDWKMYGKMQEYLQDTLKNIRESGLYKTERVITSPQNANITISGGRKVLNMCANNYLGLSDHPDVVKAAQDGLTRRGYGLSSVRFICGTQDIHLELEHKLSEFLGTDDTILYSSCFDANGGLFETLLGAEDAIISDALNHASIIDGVRLCKAQRFRYNNNDMEDLEQKLKEAAGCRFKMIATDGVFSMDGFIAKLGEICDLADKVGALVMVDDSHAVGFIGDKGRSSHELNNVIGRVDIITGTSASPRQASGRYASADARKSLNSSDSAHALICSVTPFHPPLSAPL
jgi:glycine C-acetyltransferase